MTTEIALVLDRSGSMQPIADDMKGGVKAFLDEQRGVEGECLVTIATFDHEYKLAYDGVPIERVSPVDLSPRGMTALHDAIGNTISKMDIRQKRKEASRVVFCIVTDGLENASVDYNLSDIKKMIGNHEDWQFVFLGAGIDAFAIGNDMGIQDSGISKYTKTPTALRSTFANLSENTSSYRSGATDSQFAWTDEQRASNEDG